MNYQERDDVTAAAIARRVGVGRAAVSNWRRRYPDFPKPVGDRETSPRFSWTEVEAWLGAHGKSDQLATAGRTDTGTQRIDDPARRPGDALEPVHQESAVTDLSPAQLLARVMVSLLPQLTTPARPTDTDDEESEVPAVLDPACSQATLLLAVADRFGDRVRLVGQEIQEPDAAAAALALRDNAQGAPYEIHTGDSLLDNQLELYLQAAAAVVCEPPLDIPQWPSDALTTDPRWEFGIPAPRDGELAWVQHCYAHLRPRGVAVVAVSPRTCMQASGQHIRAALVRSGVLRDVVALPKGMGSLAGTDVYLWVLQRPYRAPEHPAVRMVDLSELGDLADLPHEFAAWRRLFTDADPAICRAVSRVELLDGDTHLLPARYRATRVDPTAEDLTRVTERLQALYARVGRGLPGFAASNPLSRPARVTLAELERVGALTIRSRDTTPHPGDVLLRTLGRAPTVATGTDADDSGIAQLVELDKTRLDPHFVAMFLRADAEALPVANTLGALSRDDLRRCRIPRMPLDEQRRYGDAFRRLHELRETLSALANVAANVIDQTIHGLTIGTVTPGPLWYTHPDGPDSTESETRQP